MKTIGITDATEELSEYAQNVANEPLIVAIGGKPLAALVTIPNGDMESVSLSTNPEFIGMIESSRALLKSEGGITPEEIREHLQ